MPGSRSARSSATPRPGTPAPGSHRRTLPAPPSASACARRGAGAAWADLRRRWTRGAAPRRSGTAAPLT
eukprot:5258613-Pyramimonas_sp.AAC.1